MACHFLLQGIFPTQGSNPCLLCCRWSLAMHPDSLPTPGKPPQALQPRTTQSTRLLLGLCPPTAGANLVTVMPGLTRFTPPHVPPAVRPCPESQLRRTSSGVGSPAGTPWTVARQPSLSIEFPRREYWSGVPFPTPEGLPDPGIKPLSLVSPALAGRVFTISATWETPRIRIIYSFSDSSPI